MMNKIYLLMEATGSWDDYMNSPIGAFESKELAEKAINGFDDISEILKEVGKAKCEEGDIEEDIFFGVDGDVQRTPEEINAFWEQWDKKYAIYDSIRWSGIPTYSVQEIDLIK